MTLVMRPKPEIGQRPFVNVLLYGGPKTGKTTGALSAPGLVLDLNFDQPNATYFARSHMVEDRVFEPEIPGFEDGKPLVENLMNEVAMAITKQREAGSQACDTVVVDPIHELHRRLLDEKSRRAVRPNRDTYGDVTKIIERFCRFLVEAPVNAVFVCHDRPVKDDSTGTFERIPYTGTSNPDLALKLLGMVDVIGYTGVVRRENDKPLYVAQLIEGDGRRGGDRFGVLGEFRELNLTEWFETIGNPLLAPDTVSANEPDPIYQEEAQAA